MKFAALFLLGSIGLVTWWVVSTERPESTAPPGPPIRATALTFEGDVLWVGRSDGVLTRWQNHHSGVEWVAHDAAIRRIARRQGVLYTVSADGSLARWSDDGQSKGRERLLGHGLNDGVWHDSGAVLVAAERGTIARLDKPGWRVAGFHARAAFAIMVDPTGIVISAGADGRIARWRLKDGQAIDEWYPGGQWITRLAWHKAGLISTDSDGGVRLGKDLLWTHSAEVVTLAVDGDSIAAGDESGEIRIGGVDGTVRRKWMAPPPIVSLAMADNKIAAGCGDGLVRVWNVTDGQLLATLGADPQQEAAK